MDTRVMFTVAVALVAALRLVELNISRRHTVALLDRGGIEYGRTHYPWMIALHTSFFGAVLAELWLLRSPLDTVIAIGFAALFIAGNALRWWAIYSLGPLWCTRVIRVAGDPIVRRGPYRFLPHPNYLGVALEILALPLVHSCWRSAVVFSLLNVWMLRTRIRCEDRALGEG